MFLNLDKHKQDKLAVKDDSGYTLTYKDVCDTVGAFLGLGLERCVVFCLCESCAGSLVGYLAFENNKQVPLLLSASLDSGLRDNLESIYQPSYYWAPERKAEELGGLVSGEHGIGYAQKEFLRRQLGETPISLMQGIKQVFDPKNILNPGKVCF